MIKYEICGDVTLLQIVIKENGTGHHVASSRFPDNLKKYLKYLNKSSGFEGRTPRFFCEPPLNLD